MLLAIDVGNTQTLIGLYEKDKPELTDHWRLATHDERTRDEYALMVQEFLGFGGFDLDDVSGVAISSVVPKVTFALRAMCTKYIGTDPVVIEPGVRTGMPIRYDDPKEVGADRIANAIGAFDLFGGPTIVVDFGTATTFDVVSAKGEYLGGAIVPGVEVSLDALFGKAAGLRRVELAKPRSVIGRSTAEAIQAGVLYGTAAQVDGICRQIIDEIGPCTVVATGGLASIVRPYSKSIAHMEPWLTLHGLRMVYLRNRG
ncbi:MAG: type III pantothenate kinase [Acidimicrobiia bacterium]